MGLKEKLLPLYATEVRVAFDDEPGIDLVQQIHNAVDPEAALAELKPLKAHIVQVTIDRIAEDLGPYQGKTVVPGVVRPEELLEATSFIDYFKRLSFNYEKHEVIAMIAGLRFQNGSDIGLQSVGTLAGSHWGEGLLAEDKINLLFDRTISLTRDFQESGVRPTLYRMFDVGRYLGVHEQLQGHARATAITNMVGRVYPFSDLNDKETVLGGLKDLGERSF